jgi:hypothetical protein
MANLVYKRVSTDRQSTDRQDLVLAEAGIEDPIPFEEEAGTSSRLHPLQRPKFGELLANARPGDTVHISEMFRLVRGTGHILDVLDVLHRDHLALRIHDGAFSAMDLTARQGQPRVGEPRQYPRGRHPAVISQSQPAKIIPWRVSGVSGSCPTRGRIPPVDFSIASSTASPEDACRLVEGEVAAAGGGRERTGRAVRWPGGR